MSVGTHKLWDKQELESAIAGRISGLSYKELAIKYDRTFRSVRRAIERARMTPEQRANCQFTRRKKYAKAAIKRLSAVPMVHVAEQVIIPPFVIEDLERRLSIIPPLDHILQGTPLPTCSALDRPRGLYYTRAA